MTETLLNNQINILFKDNNMPISNDYINNFDFDIVSRLKTKSGENLLHLIVKTNNYDAIKKVLDLTKLLPKDLEVMFFTTQDKKYGYTPLHTYYNYAIKNNINNLDSNKIMTLLMEYMNSNVKNIEDYRGNKIIFKYNI
jgi:hypothetical protein